jgi:hypothetical protein
VSQLTDQRLYYEKLIAQNTVHLLESGHHIPSTVDHRFISSHGQSHHHSSVTLVSPPPPSHQQYDSSMQWAEHADQELETIENIKLDISGRVPCVVLLSSFYRIELKPLPTL